ncbi:hypothetical protein ACFO3O_12755 [Dokdonia ponticola]|uniref:TraB/GumN family protein n=1 Tax=Dokdonia ponticola TaxID=2041041 RepID=A0ABV9HX99_9FLAO
MNKSFYILLSLLLLTSCKSKLINIYLENQGVYDKHVSLHHLQNEKEKEIIFIPLFHIGTQEFYNDISSKIDSLDKQGFYFYYELVEVTNNDTILRKHKKISGKPYGKTGNLDIINSLSNGKFKPKEKIISQPNYSSLGLNKLNSKNVDITLEEIVYLYEKKLGKIFLEPCDYETTLYELTVCNDIITKKNKEVLTDLRLNYRNQVVIKEIISDSRQKIVIIYGKGHYEGIKEGLLKEGYIEN